MCGSIGNGNHTMEALKAEVVRDEGVKGMGRRIVGKVVTKEWDAVCAV